ncbi:MAG: DUF547 domain-containing protein [Chloroflexi bacterium]|nr:DUF547 domain-containing protein [Chloroflexota bacterium]MDK1044729.1 DUF547 domain-containing protein [Anaerolineales bacterium]MCH8876093.1 DUF547 domain-containing protein [Chloroflexota bacterium]MCI0773042.1 DUF547 domain-containing protein [Chloroflexota bacterium]MCI0805902.1 DUF547 domain-containing protein [Chloroflexota bacterium]
MKSENFDLSAFGVRTANQIANRVLGIGPNDLLNPEPARSGLENPARKLREIANDMRAQAISPETGEVDYGKLVESESYARFKTFARALPYCTKEDLGDRPHQIAFWINLYNALILHGVLHYKVSGSMLRDIGFFRRVAYNVGGMRFSADDIEHGVLRGNRRHPYLPFTQFAKGDPREMMSIEDPDPRMHFALVCGARSCPPISAYDGEQLDAQLDLAAAAFINGIGAQFDPEAKILFLSRIFKWYAGDFGGREGALRLVDQYLDTSVDIAGARIRYLPYDWSVNSLA